MRVLAALALMVFLLLALTAAVSTDPSQTPDRLWRAFQDPADPGLDSISINSMYQLQSDVLLLLMLLVPAVVGGLIMLAAGGRRQ